MNPKSVDNQTVELCMWYDPDTLYNVCNKLPHTAVSAYMQKIFGNIRTIEDFIHLLDVDVKTFIAEHDAL